MNKNRCKWLGLLVVSLATLFVMGGCGGSSSSSTPPATGKATISGSVSFPSLGSLVAKQVGSVVSTVIIKVYSVDTGKEVTDVTVTVNDSLTGANDYTYATTGLTPGINYVFKASRGTQVVRRFIPSTIVLANSSITGQTVDPVSTATVILVQTKLQQQFNLATPMTLGETALPASVSLSAVNSIQPTFIETSIRNDILNGTASANVTLVTSITNAVAAGTDPVTAPTVAITAQATSAATSYTPPATNVDAAVQYVAQAKDSLARQDVAGASTAFEAALVADPANKDANFGGALTKIVMMIDDPKVKDIVAKWGVISPSANQVLSHASPIGNPFQNWTSAFQKVPSTGIAKTTAKSAVSGQDAARAAISSFSTMRSTLPKFTPKGSVAKSTAKTAASTAIPATAPTVSDMQVAISGSIIPALNEALARLKKVEGTSYSFVMTKAMQGNSAGVDLTLNDGEIYALETAINAFLCVLNIGVSYDLDVYDYDGNGTRNDFDKVGQDPLKTINQGTFFTLKSTGATSMAAGLTALQGAITSLDNAYTAVKSRTAAQTAAGQGTFDLTNMTLQNTTDFEKFLGYAKKAVVGQTDILYNNDTKTIAVNITKFFSNPLTRAKLPTFGYDVPPNATLSAQYDEPVAGVFTNSYQIGSTYDPATSTYIPVYQTSTEAIRSEFEPTSDLPDYTLNGILPNNTIANNVAGFNGILPMVPGAGKLLTGSVDGYNAWSFTTDGTSIYYLTSSSTTSIKKIDIATGAVSLHASAANGTYLNGRLIWYNGKFYSISNISISPVTITGSTFTVDMPVASLSSTQASGNISAVASNGTDIYYAVTTWNMLTWSSSTEVRKLSNLTTDVLLVTIPDYVDSLAFQNGFLYTNGDKRDPAATYSVVASYANGYSDVMVGGYNYKAYGGKLVKYAGTPAGGAAKVALAKYFGM